jgi:hypothetical protein
MNIRLSTLFGRRKHCLAAVVAAALLLVPLTCLAFRTRFSLLGHLEGLFLLRGENGDLFELKDDLYLGDGSRLIAGVDLKDFGRSAQRQDANPHRTSLQFEWDEEDGSGIITSHLPGGRVLLTHFSRYEDSQNQTTHGLFVGGATPAAAREDSPLHHNDTGMAYFDGHRWQHIWCNTNEGIGSAINPANRFAPSAWKFLGSRILSRSDKRLVLASAHEVLVDQVPLRIERYAYFTAGQLYFDLGIKITNLGDRAAHYFYLYGDEPWLGDFGSSAGDVGWAGDRLINYEQVIDPQTYSSAGMFDYGNDAIGEGHYFARVANFIEWLGPNRPDTVYFANRYDGYNHPDSFKVPLAGNSRSIGVLWGPKAIRPGESHAMFLSIGMALPDPATGLPRAPDATIQAHSLPFAGPG